MTEEEQRIAIAQACGATWTTEQFNNPMRVLIRGDVVLAIKPTERPLIVIFLPDYLHDLNAMHEAEKTLSDSQYGSFSRNLEEIIAEVCWGKGRDFCGMEFPENMARFYSATAAQRAEAFLKTLGLWKSSDTSQTPTSTQ